MIIYKDKAIKEIKPHKWFAWYPIWAWEDKSHDKLHGVWLQRVWRTNGYKIKYKYYLKI